MATFRRSGTQVFRHLFMTALLGGSMSSWVGCAPTPHPVHVDSGQVVDAVGASLQDAQQSSAQEAHRTSLLDQHYSWLRDAGAVPVDQASDREKELARAVVQILDIASGKKGTGFFVSPDGLLLTNEHVVPRGFCSRERCAGFSFVRGFSARGDLEFFGHARAVAFSPMGTGKDFALLQVELQPGRSVPYIPLESADVRESFDLWLGQGILRVLGHPGGGPALSLQTSLPFLREALAPGTVSYETLGFSGASGSPLVNLETGKAIALTSGVSTGSFNSSVSANGNLRRLGELGTLSSEILSHLHEAYPETQGDSELSGASFASASNHAAERRLRALTLPSVDSKIPEVAPGLAEFSLSPAERIALKIEPAELPSLSGSFFHHFMGTRYAGPQLEKLLAEMADPGRVPEIVNALTDLLRLQDWTGAPLPISGPQVALIQGGLAQARLAPGATTGFLIRLSRNLGLPMFVDNQPADCRGAIERDGSLKPLDKAHALARLCRIREDGLELLKQSLVEAEPGTWPDTKSFAARELLSSLINASPWREGEVDVARQIVTRLIEHAPSWFELGELERIALLLERAPERIGFAAYQGILGAPLPDEGILSGELQRLRAALQLPAPERVD